MKIPAYKIILALIDFILLRSSFFAATQLNGISLVTGDRWMEYIASPEFYSFFIFSFFILIVFQSRHLYKRTVLLDSFRHVVVIFICIAYSVVGLSAIAFFIHSPWIIDSRLMVAYFAIFSFISISLFRIFIFVPLFLYVNKTTLKRKKVVIIGSGIPAKSFAIEMGIGNIYGFELVGFINNAFSKGQAIYEKYRVLGSLDDIPVIVEKEGIDEIIIAESGVNYDELMRIIDLCKHTSAHVNVASPLFEVVHKKFTVDSYFDLPIAPLRSVHDESIIWSIKRGIDIVGSLIGLMVLAIPLLLIAILIKISSPGPVLYKQTRIGKAGKPFSFYKFRSMQVGSDQDKERIQKMHDYIKGNGGTGKGWSKVINESMVTPIGKFIRRTSLDELPQLFNVLKGDMSLVGPRPCLPYEYEAYNEWHKRRLTVLPGCTGLWQVSSRAEGGFDEMVVLDLYYIGNVSPTLDIQLILKTIPVMVFGRGGK